jgi:hypothetical protein
MPTLISTLDRFIEKNPVLFASWIGIHAADLETVAEEV